MNHPRVLVAKKPRVVSLELSTKCTLNCTYCGRKDMKGENMSLEKFRDLKKQFEQIPDLKGVVFCGIGESLLNAEMYTMLEELGNYKITLVTSGTVIVDLPRLDKHGNVELVVFSIDATDEESVQNICGKNYNFKNLIANLDNFYQYKRKTRRKLNALINTTVNPSNVDQLDDIMEFARKNKLMNVHYSLSWANEEFIIQNSEKLDSVFTAARKKARKYGIYCDDPFKSYCCLNNDSIVSLIDIEGNFYPCCYGLNQQFSVGNVFEKDFDSIWESPAYKNFQKGKLCNSCYMLRMTDIRAGRVTMDNYKNVKRAAPGQSIKLD